MVVPSVVAVPSVLAAPVIVSGSPSGSVSFVRTVKLAIEPSSFTEVASSFAIGSSGNDATSIVMVAVSVRPVPSSIV